VVAKSAPPPSSLIVSLNTNANCAFSACVLSINREKCGRQGRLFHFGRFCRRIVLFKSFQNISQPLLFLESDVLISDKKFVKLHRLAPLAEFAATPGFLLGDTRKEKRFINLTHPQMNVGIFTASQPEKFFSERFFGHMGECKSPTFAGFNDMRLGTLEQICMSIYVHLYTNEQLWLPGSWQCRGYLFTGVAQGNLDNCFTYHHHNNAFARDYVKRKLSGSVGLLSLNLSLS
jgi:hypothetical protein